MDTRTTIFAPASSVAFIAGIMEARAINYAVADIAGGKRIAVKHAFHIPVTSINSHVKRDAVLANNLFAFTAAIWTCQ